MADFVAVLRKTIDGLGDNPSAEMRAKVYDKARATIAAKLAALNPPPPAAVAERQKRSLEEAIAQVESEYAPAKPMRDRSDPLAELEQVFASLQAKPEIKPIAPTPSAPVTPAVAKAAPVQPQPASQPARPSTPADTWTSGSVAAGAAKPASAAATAADPLPAPRPTPPAPPAAAIDPFDTPQRETPASSKRVIHQPETVLPAAADEVDEDGDNFAVDDLRTTQLGPDGGLYDEPVRRRSLAMPIAAGIAALVVAGGAYAVWLNSDDFASMFGMGGGTEVAATQPQETAPAATQAEQPAPAPAQPTAAPAESAPPAEGRPQKFTQRLNPDGTEIDEGPAGGAEPTVGEGTTVAAATQPGEAPAPTAPTDSAAPANDAVAATGTQAPAPSQPSAAQVAVGQKAIFYEERTTSAQGSAESGSVVWSVVRESPGGDAPPEPAIRGEATIPGKDLQLRMTIRRNADQTLPASHIIELIFLTPEGFGGGGIDNILRFALKDREEAPGNPLIGIPAKIADGYFLIALNDSKAEIDANMQLLGRQSWIDIPVVYKSGRRALITMEKGIPGEKAFEEAMKSWQAANAG